MNRYANLHNDEIALRPITQEDEGFLFAVYASTRLQEMALVAWPQPQKDGFLRMQFRAQDRFYRENYPNAQFQIIMLGKQPVGRLYLHRRANEIRIMDIALLPEYRNRGIGSILLKEILAEGRQCRLPVTIHVERFNPALRLYERLGFRFAEDKGVYYLLEWSPAGKE